MGFAVVYVCVYVCASECMFFPMVDTIELVCRPQIASLIWHISHSQFPPLMHDSSTLCSTGDCREESTTTACLSDCLSLSTLLELSFLADESYLLYFCFLFPPSCLSGCVSLCCCTLIFHTHSCNGKNT